MRINNEKRWNVRCRDFSQYHWDPWWLASCLHSLFLYINSELCWRQLWRKGDFTIIRISFILGKIVFSGRHINENNKCSLSFRTSALKLYNCIITSKFSFTSIHLGILVACDPSFSHSKWIKVEKVKRKQNCNNKY